MTKERCKEIEQRKVKKGKKKINAILRIKEIRKGKKVLNTIKERDENRGFEVGGSASELSSVRLLAEQEVIRSMPLIKHAENILWDGKKRKSS